MVDILKCNIPIFIYLRYLFIDPCNNSHNYFYFYFNVKLGFHVLAHKAKWIGYIWSAFLRHNIFSIEWKANYKSIEVCFPNTIQHSLAIQTDYVMLFPSLKTPQWLEKYRDNVPTYATFHAQFWNYGLLKMAMDSHSKLQITTC